ncbi:MAG: hypothetical protein COV91_03740 [Candidatus Taylorbacteria bacterium CG11_big_fil_rev_8_21_14_0_20_46_11]|uniref:Uncharacterized protein n=1 Tax=Candidatus Taylorbacteria bacterium CG11_big_fil_rev_8_21_14_0_20_46_11 TaxID=1975025 RepID=A0A2H0KB87_9BACT|nr:MAG: hypothetical protein COV91_03740 [Candidatus Taylorbacteria bacterium CG11_big_fil_rev_8_21_14_0_20_46_11]
MTFVYIVIIAILLFIGYQLWKNNIISTQVLKSQMQKDSDEILKQKFPLIFLDYKDEIKNYWNRLQRAEKSPNTENWGMHWSYIHMGLTDNYKPLSPEYNELDKLRLETGKLLEQNNKRYSEAEGEFLAWKLWNELSEFDVHRISQKFSEIANKYFHKVE